MGGLNLLFSNEQPRLERGDWGAISINGRFVRDGPYDGTDSRMINLSSGGDKIRNWLQACLLATQRDSRWRIWRKMVCFVKGIHGDTRGHFKDAFLLRKNSSCWSSRILLMCSVSTWTKSLLRWHFIVRLKKRNIFVQERSLMLSMGSTIRVC